MDTPCRKIYQHEKASLAIGFIYDVAGIVDDFIPYSLQRMHLFCAEICAVGFVLPLIWVGYSLFMAYSSLIRISLMHPWAVLKLNANFDQCDFAGSMLAKY